MADAFQKKLTSVQNPKSLVGLWIFAILWCGISFTVFGAFAFQARDFMGGAIGGLFSLLGLAMLYGAVTSTLEYWRYGNVRLTLARPPETGGKLEAKVEFPDNDSLRGFISAELACVQVVWSRNSKGESSKSERDDWTGKHVFAIRRGLPGTEAAIAIDVPANQPASSLPQENTGDAMFEGGFPGLGVAIDKSYYRWELRVSADLPGVDLARTFRLRVAAGAGAAPVPAAPERPRPARMPDLALEHRLNQRKALERKLALVCLVMAVGPFLAAFAIAGLGVGLAGCPMSWGSANPPACELAGINWGRLMARSFDLVFIAVPAGIASSAVFYFVGQVWIDRRLLTDSSGGAGRFTQLAIGAIVVAFFVYQAWRFMRPGL